jgi:hypothetical protein
MNLRITQKNQELTLKALEQSAKAQELTLRSQEQNLETRQAQLFMQILIVNQSKELAESWFKIYTRDLGDVKELVKKIYITGEQPDREFIQNLAVIGTHYDGVGLYARKGLIDLDMVHQLLEGDIIMMWEKLGPLLLEVRKVSSFKTWNFEWLYNKLKALQGQPPAQ